MKDAVDEPNGWVRRLRMWGADRVLIVSTIDSSVAFSFGTSHTIANRHGNTHKYFLMHLYGFFFF